MVTMAEVVRGWLEEEVRGMEEEAEQFVTELEWGGEEGGGGSMPPPPPPLLSPLPPSPRCPLPPSTLLWCDTSLRLRLRLRATCSSLTGLPSLWGGT